jgi:formiminotetrahydrofolate cyclodeaminase
VEDPADFRFRDLTLDEFVERLASAQPTPGGGSASAVAASLAAGLVAMVAALSEGRPKYADHAALIARARAAGGELADRCLRLADEDAAAYGGFSAALKLPKESDADREARTLAIRAAARAAAIAPLGAVEACREIVEHAEALAGRSNANAASDLAVAALLAEAGARGAAANVLVNLPMTGDEALSTELSARVEDLLGDIERLAVETREVVRSGAPRPPLPDPA